MISRFFKKKPIQKKAAPQTQKKEKRVEKPIKTSSPKKLLTAEGWKRLMMKKTGKSKTQPKK